MKTSHSTRRTLFALAASLVLGCAVAGETLPRVDPPTDPSKSYWDTYVHYAYPHQYAVVADGTGVKRELAYLDLYRGKATARATAPVLVLIHGRSMHSGYWGNLIETPLDAGYRVISIDWSNTGKSLPRNLDKPLTRTLDDVRHMIHQLVTVHLQIPRAYYLGHSLGGQVLAGYLLDYPQAVERAVLYAPGGLEGFAGRTPAMIGWLAHNDTLFKLIWASQSLPDIGESEEKIEGKFYSTRKADNIPYLKRNDPLGAFMVASHALALKGNPVELERFRQSHAWDSLASILESGKDDPHAIFNRLDQLRVPTLLTFGTREPTIPIPGTGNEHLVDDLIAPLAQRVARKHLPLQIKLYEGAGHFLHTDLPDQFPRDVLQFLRTGRAPQPLYPAR